MRLIDAEKFCEENQNFNSEVYVAISKASTVDAVEVVRCGDCRFFNHDRIISPNSGVCKFCEMIRFDFDYCSCAERR